MDKPLTSEQRARLVSDGAAVRAGTMRFPVTIDGLPQADETIEAEAVTSHAVHSERMLAVFETTYTDIMPDPPDSLQTLVEFFHPPEMKASIFRRNGREICLYEWTAGDNWSGYMVDTATNAMVGRNSDCILECIDQATAEVFVDRDNVGFTEQGIPPEKTSIRRS